LPNLVCVTIQNVEAQPQLEEHIFGLTERLGGYCDSIARCRVEIIGPASHSAASQTWSAKFAVGVMENEVVGAGNAITATAALQAAFEEATAKLRLLPHEHCLCARRRQEAGAESAPLADDRLICRAAPTAA